MAGRATVPAVWYFDDAGLQRLAEFEGLGIAYSGRLASVSRQGLWQRTHLDRKPTPLTVSAVFVGMTVAPVLNGHRASDIIHLIFRAPAPS